MTVGKLAQLGKIICDEINVYNWIFNAKIEKIGSGMFVYNNKDQTIKRWKQQQ